MNKLSRLLRSWFKTAALYLSAAVIAEIIFWFVVRSYPGLIDPELSLRKLAARSSLMLAFLTIYFYRKDKP